MPAATNVGLRSSALLPVAYPLPGGQAELFTCSIAFASGVASISSSSHFCSISNSATGRYTLVVPSANRMVKVGFEVADSDDTFGAAESAHHRFGDVTLGATTSVELKFFETDGGTVAFAAPPDTQTADVTLLLSRDA